MVDPWADRIKLNVDYTPTRNAQVSMPASSQGTVEAGLNDSTSSDSASSTDISDSFETRTLPDDRVVPLPF